MLWITCKACMDNEWVMIAQVGKYVWSKLNGDWGQMMGDAGKQTISRRGRSGL